MAGEQVVNYPYIQAYMIGGPEDGMKRNTKQQPPKEIWFEQQPYDICLDGTHREIIQPPRVRYRLYDVVKVDEQSRAIYLFEGVEE